METTIQILYVAMGVLTAILIAFGIFYTVVYFIKKSETEKELKDIIRMCKKIDGNVQKGIAAFDPPVEEVGYYEVLVDRGVMVKNPLGGYSFSDSYRSTWGGIPDSFSSAGNEYEDDDGVMQVFEYGKTKIKITEDMLQGEDINEMMACISIDRFFKSLGLEVDNG